GRGHRQRVPRRRDRRQGRCARCPGREDESLTMARTGKRRNPRQFQCEDVLWNTFNRMAEEQESDVDDLINEALLSYAQLAGYQTGVSEEDTPPPSPARGGGHRPPAPSPMSSTAHFGGRGGIPAPSAGLGAGAPMLPAPAPPPP